MAPKSVLAWHIIPESRELQYGDGRKVVAGRKLSVDCSPKLCESGLHASVNILDALNYSKQPIVCRVRVGGTIVHGDDKLVSTERTCLWMVDATRVFREFACWCAERALTDERKRGREPDPRSWEAVRVARLFAQGKADREKLQAARSAAAYAVAAAAWGAAYAYDAAAYAAAAYAAYAAYAAAAAAVAAYAYARSGARQKERDAQEQKLAAMLTAEHRRLSRGRK